MDRKNNKELVVYAKELRNNMTDEERHLWYDFLRTYQVRFQRQKVLGKYIADFYSAKAKLVIEIDGSQHYSPEGKKYDSERTKYLESYGIRIIRIPNNLVKSNFKSVCDYIDIEVTRSLSQLRCPAPFTQGSHSTSDTSCSEKDFTHSHRTQKNLCQKRNF